MPRTLDNRSIAELAAAVSWTEEKYRATLIERWGGDTPEQALRTQRLYEDIYGNGLGLHEYILPEFQKAMAAQQAGEITSDQLDVLRAAARGEYTACTERNGNDAGTPDQQDTARSYGLLE